ncbi:hypothetical protein ACMEBS_003468 [Salmonella enterica]
MAAGFQAFNARGALTIDSTNKSIVTSQVLGMQRLIDVGYYIFGNNSIGNGQTLGFTGLNQWPTKEGIRWCQLLVDGTYCFPGAELYEQDRARFMISSNTTPLQSGYFDVFNASGQLVWSAASAGTMPRIQDFFNVPAGHDLGTAITLNTSFPNPWFCVSQCPGNISDDGTVAGYSGILIRRNNAQSFTLQYINRNQKNYTQAMGNNGIRIALASVTGY